jgi:superoxide reductase
MKFGDFLKGADREGKEKHVPHIAVKECSECGGKMVDIIVGKETPHPNTVEHHIASIQLYGLKDGGQLVHILSADLGPVVANPCAHVCINKEGLKSLIALEYCNIHGVWENSIDL